MSRYALSREVLGRIEELPTLPEVLVRLMRLLENPKTSAKDVTKVLVLDPALAFKILRIVNSAFYGFPREVRTVAHAVMILGFKEVKNIALSVSVFDLFNKSEATDAGYDRVAFWKHSMGVGIAARILARRMKLRSPEDLYEIGLLHDVGKIVLDEFFHDRFAAIVRAARERETLFINVERELHDLDHAAVGGLICRHWQIPEPIVAGVEGHHADSFPMLEAALIHVADILVRRLRIGSGGDERVPRLMKDAWEMLKLNPDDLIVLHDRILDEVGRADAFLELTKPANV